MAKSKKPPVEALTESEAPETALPVFPGIDADLVPADAEWQAVRLDGPGDADPSYLVPKPLPLTLDHGTSHWDLSDRKAGVYIPRHR